MNPSLVLFQAEAQQLQSLSSTAVMHQSFVSTAPSGPGISGAFNFSIFKAQLKALLSGAKIMVKSLLKAPALPGADNNEEQQMI